MRRASVLAFVAMAACNQPAAAAIEFLTRSGCVQTKIMRVRTEAAIKELALPNPYTVVDLNSLPSPDVRKFYPTPTVLVGNVDLFGMAAPTSPYPEPT